MPCSFLGFFEHSKKHQMTIPESACVWKLLFWQPSNPEKPLLSSWSSKPMNPCTEMIFRARKTVLEPLTCMLPYHNTSEINAPWCFNALRLNCTAPGLPLPLGYFWTWQKTWIMNTMPIFVLCRAFLPGNFKEIIKIQPTEPLHSVLGAALGS